MASERSRSFLNHADYLARCSELFHSLLSSLVKARPAEPIEFLKEQLENWPREQKEALKQSLQGIEKPTESLLDRLYLTFSLDFPSDLPEEKRCFLLNSLKALRKFALSQPGCYDYQILQDSYNSSHLSIYQVWASQGALEDFHRSKEFSAAGKDFQGFLTRAPEEKILKRIE